MVTLKQTLSDLKADFGRRLLLEGKKMNLFSCLCVTLKRGMLSVIIYRAGRLLVHHRLGIIYYPLSLFEKVFIKNEISPFAQLGSGLVLGDNGGIGITHWTTCGENCTFLGCTSITLGAMEGFDVNKDRIQMGDYCLIGPRVRIMRPVFIANGTQIKPNSVVLFSVEIEGVTLSGIPAKRRNIDSYDEVIRWNPLYGGYILGVGK